MKKKNAGSTFSLRKKKMERSLSRTLESGSHNKIIT